MIMFIAFIITMIFYYYINAIGATGNFNTIQPSSIAKVVSKYKPSKAISMENGPSHSFKPSISSISTLFFLSLSSQLSKLDIT